MGRRSVGSESPGVQKHFQTLLSLWAHRVKSPLCYFNTTISRPGQDCKVHEKKKCLMAKSERCFVKTTWKGPIHVRSPYLGMFWQFAHPYNSNVQPNLLALMLLTGPHAIALVCLQSMLLQWFLTFHQLCIKHTYSHIIEWNLIPACRSQSAKLSGNLRNQSVKSACFVGQRAQTAHMLPTHITSHLGNAHILKAFIFPFFPVWLVREISLPAHIPSQKNAWLNLSQMGFPHVWALIRKEKQWGETITSKMCLCEHLCMCTWVHAHWAYVFVQEQAHASISASIKGHLYGYEIVHLWIYAWNKLIL